MHQQDLGAVHGAFFDVMDPQHGAILVLNFGVVGIEGVLLQSLETGVRRSENLHFPLPLPTVSAL